MPARGFIAAIFALVVLAGGAYFTLDYKDAGVNDVLELLRRDDPDASLLCWLAAWGSLGAAALAVIAAFAAFVIEDDDDDGFRRRGFPKIIPLILILVSLVLFWAMFDCAARGEPPVTTVISKPAPPPPPAAPVETRPSAPVINVELSAFGWPFMIPLIDDGGFRETPEVPRALARIFPLHDDEQPRALLCEAAWVMIAGAASEEGPRPRNETRSRIRAEMASAKARQWLAAHTDDCRAPVVFALDLGQHAPSLPPVAGDGSDTGFQRAVIVVSRLRRDGEEPLSISEALGEADDYIADPDSLRAMLAGRVYTSAPRLFLPTSGAALD